MLAAARWTDDGLQLSLAIDGARASVVLAVGAWKRGEREGALKCAMGARLHVEAAERLAPGDPRVVEVRAHVEAALPRVCTGGCNRTFSAEVQRADEDLRICRGCRARLGNGEG